VPVTPARYAEILGGIAVGGGDDVRIADALSRAETLCWGECGWRVGDGGTNFSTQTVTAYAERDEAEPSEALLPCAKVQSVTDAWVDSTRTFDAGDVLTDIEVEDDRVIRGDGDWSANRRHNRVVYTCGWGALPEYVEEPIARLAHHLLMGKPGSNVRAGSFGGQSVTQDPPMHQVPADIVSMLEAAGLIWWGGRVG